VNTTDLPDARTLVRSLRDTDCPACGGEKRANNSLCRRCYFGISHATRTALYDRVGAGYETAIAGAFRELGVTTPRWPMSPAASRETR